jgi:ribA/ribD-fused uncharacterized protein
VVYDGVVYSNSEAAYQAAKCRNPEQKIWFEKLDPGPAKRLGKGVVLRFDWEEVKDQVMYDICLAKFTQNLDLAKLLVETGDEELIEGNTWGDVYWGQVDGVGRNQLGKTLMQIRDKFSGRNLV